MRVVGGQPGSADRLRAGRGSVVNVASIVGLGPGPQPLAYAAALTGVSWDFMS